MLDGLLIAFALVNLLYGLWALVDAKRAAALVKLEPQSKMALGEIRALYGGLVGALGAITLWSLGHEDQDTILRMLGLAFVGIALGRIASLVLDGPTRWNLLLLIGEGGTAGFLGWAGDQIAKGA